MELPSYEWILIEDAMKPIDSQQEKWTLHPRR